MSFETLDSLDPSNLASFLYLARVHLDICIYLDPHYIGIGEKTALSNFGPRLWTFLDLALCNTIPKNDHMQYIRDKDLYTPWTSLARAESQAEPRFEIRQW